MFKKLFKTLNLTFYIPLGWFVMLLSPLIIVSIVYTLVSSLINKSFNFPLFFLLTTAFLIYLAQIFIIKRETYFRIFRDKNETKHSLIKYPILIEFYYFGLSLLLIMTFLSALLNIFDPLKIYLLEKNQQHVESIIDLNDLITKISKVLIITIGFVMIGMLLIFVYSLISSLIRKKIFKFIFEFILSGLTFLIIFYFLMKNPDFIDKLLENRFLNTLLDFILLSPPYLIFKLLFSKDLDDIFSDDIFSREVEE